MKVKSSRGIAMKLVCCTALVVLSSAFAFSQATTVNITDVAVSAPNATYTYNSLTATGPALQVGKSIQITGMAATGNNGTFTITALPSATSFTVVNAAAVAANSQNGTGIEFNVTSGALLTIKDSSNAVILKIYDSQIHSSTNTSTTQVSKVQSVPVGSGGSACNPADQIPTDAYVLQGGSPTGCDPSDPFEVTDNNNFNTAHQVFGKTDLLGFHIETHYKMNTAVSISAASDASAGSTTYTYGLTSGPDLQANETIVITNMGNQANNGTFTISSVGSGMFVANNAGGFAENAQNGSGTVTWCNTSGTICASPDSGFLTVTNNTNATTGTISLTGTSRICGDASDSTSGLAPTNSVTLALGAPGVIDSSNCGGFNQAQILSPSPVAPNVTSKASFGKDAYLFTPLNVVSGDVFSVLPIPVPAGPTGNETSVVNSSLFFSPGANFSGLKCVPYADFSAPGDLSTPGNPVCVELHEECTNAGGPCTDAPNILYTVENDYNIDANSLGPPSGGIGGPAFIGHHGVNCPDSGFNLNIFSFYQAPSVTFGDPLKGSGSGTTSCWVAAFDPTATAITAGNTFAPFVGLLSPVSDTDLNLVKPGSAIPVIWQLFKSPGVPLIENLSFCPSSGGSGCATPWVFVGTIATSCMADNTPNTATETSSTMSTVGTVVQNFQNGTYQVNLKTAKGSTGCFDVLLIFDTGLAEYPANFKYMK